MPSKSKSKSQRQGQTQVRRVWDEDSTAELLAWLDYCCKYGIDFQATVVNHLHDKTGRRRDLDQVKSRLRLKWGQWGSDEPGSNSRDIYHKGTSCLTRIDSEEKEPILEASRRLGEPDLRYRLRSTTSATRSTDRSPSRTLPTVQQALEAPQPPPPNLTSTASLLQVPPTPFESAPVPSSAPKQEKGEVPDSDEYPPYPNSSSSAADENTITPGRDIGRDISGDWRRLGDLEGRLQDKETQLAESRTAALAHRSQLFTLSNQFSAIRQENDQLLRSIRAAESQQDKTALLSKLQYENLILKHRLAASQSYQDDTRELEAGTLGPTKAEIKREMIVIEDIINDAASSLWGMHIPFLVENLDIPEHSRAFTETLITKVTGWNSIDQFSVYIHNNDIPRLEAVRSIASVGISTLVFETTFPDFQLVESPLLDQYRKHLLIRDGPNSLRDLDLLAHKSVISHANFISQIIANKAKKLASQLVEALSPFINPSTSIPPGDEMVDIIFGADPSLHIEDDEDQREENISPTEAFQSVVETALTVRARMILGGPKQYGLVYVLPGTDFNPETMNQNRQNRDDDNDATPNRVVHTGKKYPRRRLSRTSSHKPPTTTSSSDGNSDGNSSTPTKKVKLCLFPALYCRAPPPVDQAGGGANVDIGDLLVQCRVFTDGDHADPGSSGNGFELIAKAVVLV